MLGIIGIVFWSIVLLVMIPRLRNKTQTDIKVDIFTGIAEENQLGGIRFKVFDRWDYDNVTFRIIGFDEGLNLDVVIYESSRETKYANELSSDWENTWLPRYQEVLAEATTGTVSSETVGPNSIPVQ